MFFATLEITQVHPDAVENLEVIMIINELCVAFTSMQGENCSP